MTTHGQVRLFSVPTPDSVPDGITPGLDGAIWFTEQSANQLGRISVLSQTMTEVPIPTPNSKPFALTTGPDLHIWFVEVAGNNVGRYDVFYGH